MPNFERALEQHTAYCAALSKCGLEVLCLDPDPNHPDSTFVEDTAVLIEPHDESSTSCVVITRPGAASRLGEVESIRNVLGSFAPKLFTIEAPGTLDGGDICQAGSHFFIGLSERTNEEGAQQLADLLGSLGYTSTQVDIRAIDGLLHLKSGLSYLGDYRLAVTASMEKVLPADVDFELVQVNSNEEYAANCVRINDQVLVAAGYTMFAQRLRELGYQIVPLDMSEFQKMDGGLSCLSLRF